MPDLQQFKRRVGHTAERPTVNPVGPSSAVNRIDSD
jgi:hypothetical protein